MILGIFFAIPVLGSWRNFSINSNRFFIYLFIYLNAKTVPWCYFFLFDCVSDVSFSCARRADVQGPHWAASLKAVPTSTTTGVLWSWVSVTLCPPIFHIAHRSRVHSLILPHVDKSRCNLCIAFWLTWIMLTHLQKSSVWGWKVGPNDRKSW